MRIQQLHQSPQFVLSVSFTGKDPMQVRQKLDSAMHAFGDAEYDDSWSDAGVHSLEWTLSKLDVAKDAFRTLMQAVQSPQLAAVAFNNPTLRDASGRPIKPVGQ